MSIPLPPLVKSAYQYPFQNGTTGVVSNTYPKEGEKAIPMQFGFDQQNLFLVDLEIALNSLNLSQLRGLYIDATNSAHDVTVTFIETGFSVTVKAGYSRLVSLVNIRYGFRFYVYLDGQIYDPLDKINIIALNTMYPPFNTFALFGETARTKFNLAHYAFLQNTSTAGGGISSSFQLGMQGLETGGTNYKVLQSNMAIMLCSMPSGLSPDGKNLKVQIQMAYSPSYPPVYAASTVVSDHIITADNSDIRLFTGVSPNYNVAINTFFLKDILNYEVVAHPFTYTFNIWVKILQGRDGGWGDGAGSSRPYNGQFSAINWTYSLNGL